MRRPRVWILAVACLLCAALLLLVRGASEPVESEMPPRTAVAGVHTDLARVLVDSARDAIEIVIGPVTLPAGNEGLRTPIQLVELPVGGAVHGFSWRVTDAGGRALPNELLHHVNLIDPDRRELFSTTARRVIAAGRETGAQSFTPLIGYPIARGTRLLVVAMFSNPSESAIENAYLRVRLQYSRAERKLEPLPIFPFSIDVMGAVGEKSFPVPPGRTERSWEGSPAVDARVLAISGHMHDYASALRLEDVTTGEVLWEAVPETDAGRVVSVPVHMPWKTGGIKLRRDHRYRVSVVYDNPTDRPSAHGGMGVIAGIAHVRGSWPPLRPDDPEYRQDLENVISAPLRTAGHGHAHMH